MHLCYTPGESVSCWLESICVINVDIIAKRVIIRGVWHQRPDLKPGSICITRSVFDSFG